MEQSRANGRVAGKVALVTGAASGIGRATAITLAEHGAAVVCADLDPAGTAATVTTITAAGGSAHSCLLDVASEAAWEAAMAAVLQANGRLDILVNCAGISIGGSIADTPLADWRRVMAVNLDGVFLGTKHAVRAMRQTATRGSIVNVASVSGLKAQPEAAAYCTSKAGIIMLTKSVAVECLRNGSGIRVNAVSPGGVKTPMWKTMPFFQDLMRKKGGEDGAFAALAAIAPYARWAEPEEVAVGILYLASDESGYVNGSNLVIDLGDNG